MKTLERFEIGIESIPASTAWALADLAEAKGKQDLFSKQSPQKLKVLRDHALIESAVSSNRIEGVEVDRNRIGTLAFGRPSLQDRDEEEVKGYCDALTLVHERHKQLELSVDRILQFHKMCRGEIWDAGRLKEKDGDIIERLPDGRVRVRFKTVTAKDTPQYSNELLELWDRSQREKWVHPLVALAAFNLDFLCIHPFRDGNGRVSRLLLLLQCYHLGYEVGRYISIERTIEQNKERYYETLEQSSQGWHDGKHDFWPYTNYLLFVLKSAYREFEQRVGRVKEPRGAKTELVQNAITSFSGQFSVTELESACPGVSRDMIRKVLRDLRKAGKVRPLGRGPGAPWEKV